MAAGAKDIIGVLSGASRVLTAGYTDLCTELEHFVNNSSLGPYLPGSFCTNHEDDQHFDSISDFPEFYENIGRDFQFSNTSHNTKRGFHTAAIHYSDNGSQSEPRSEQIVKNKKKVSR